MLSPTEKDTLFAAAESFALDLALSENAVRLLTMEMAATHAAKFGLSGETETRAVFGVALLIVKRRGEIMRHMQHVYVEEMHAPDGESLH